VLLDTMERWQRRNTERRDGMEHQGEIGDLEGMGHRDGSACLARGAMREDRAQGVQRGIGGIENIRGDTGTEDHAPVPEPSARKQGLGAKRWRISRRRPRSLHGR
jgi:hypothetical protein